MKSIEIKEIQMPVKINGMNPDEVKLAYDLADAIVTVEERDQEIIELKMRIDGFIKFLGGCA